MLNRFVTSALLALALLPAAATAQTKPARFVGDDSSLSPNAPRDRLGFDGSRSSSNVGGVTDLNNIGGARNVTEDQRAEPIRYYAYRRNPDGTIDRTSPPTLQTLTLPISAADWVRFLKEHLNRNDPSIPAGERFADVDYNGVRDTTQSPPPIPLSFDPPRNKIAVVDQGVRKERIDAGQPPEVFQLRTVTVVTRWVDAIPQYGEQCVTAYPCCCTQCFSYIVGYTYVPRVETRTEQRPVADYPVTEIAVDRGIVVQAGSPKYTTQVPRLCEFHYGAGAKITLPTVPLASDINDIPTTTRTEVTVTTAGGVTTEITAPMTDPLVAGSEPRGPNYGGLPDPGARGVAVLTTRADRGTTTFAGDTATVANVTAKGERNLPYTYHEAAP